MSGVRPRMGTDSPDLDSLEYVTAKVRTLDGFVSLLKERAAAYRGGQKLTEWFVHGRWHLDSCANAGLARAADIAGASRGLLRPVMRKQEFWDVVGHDVSVSFSFPGRLPNDASRCLECGLGWVPESLHDHVRASDGDGVDDPTFCHRLCFRMRAARLGLESFRQDFLAAGYGPETLTFRPIDNGYCPCDHCAPWYVVGTELGDLVIGWRKRVVVLDWSRTGTNYVHLFGGETTTKDNDMIHAWPGKLSGYLATIRDHSRLAKVREVLDS